MVHLSLDHGYKLTFRWVDAILWRQLHEPVLISELEKQLLSLSRSSLELPGTQTTLRGRRRQGTGIRNRPSPSSAKLCSKLQRENSRLFGGFPVIFGSSASCLAH